MTDLDQEWQRLTRSRRWVVKIGSSLLTNEGRGLDAAAISTWVDQIASLRKQSLELVIVSSGSIAEGMARLQLSQRPREIHRLQAAAAVGQMGLIQAYESNFQRHQLHTAQVLLTHDDLSNRGRYLNARSAIRELLRLGVIPVINENDTVVTDEIRFGDNDSLAGLVANLVEADALIVLTDQQGLHQKDPRTFSDAPLVPVALAHDRSLDEMASGSGGELGQGGMTTKIRGARIAARSGAVTVICNGKEVDVLERLYNGEALGTLLLPDLQPLQARKQWLAGHLQSRGTLVLDDGAVAVLQAGGSSLLPVGVSGARGSYKRGDMVTCEDKNGTEIARGLINYNSEDSLRILGSPSKEIASILGYVSELELIHRDNLVLV